VQGGFSLWIVPAPCFLLSLVTGHWTLVTAADAAQEQFLLAYRGVSVHNAHKEKDKVMRDILFRLLMMVVFLALAGC
jgi:hypothetical protein